MCGRRENSLSDLNGVTLLLLWLRQARVFVFFWADEGTDSRTYCCTCYERRLGNRAYELPVCLCLAKSEYVAYTKYLCL